MKLTASTLKQLIREVMEESLPGESGGEAIVRGCRESRLRPAPGEYATGTAMAAFRGGAKAVEKQKRKWQRFSAEHELRWQKFEAWFNKLSKADKAKVLAKLRGAEALSSRKMRARTRAGDKPIVSAGLGPFDYMPGAAIGKSLMKQLSRMVEPVAGKLIGKIDEGGTGLGRVMIEEEEIEEAKKKKKKKKAKKRKAKKKEKDKDWIQKAVDPKHKGYCTPMTKKTCTPRRKALAMRFKKAGRKEKREGGTGWQGKV